MRLLFMATAVMAVFTTSFASAAPLVLISAPTDPAYVSADANMLTVIADGTVMTVEPDPHAKVIGVLKVGDQVTILDSGGKWVHVRSKNMDGYVPKSALE